MHEADRLQAFAADIQATIEQLRLREHEAREVARELRELAVPGTHPTHVRLRLRELADDLEDPPRIALAASVGAVPVWLTEHNFGPADFEKADRSPS